jgi:reactive intermediate/imine deaminase
MFEIISTTKAPAAIGTYSQAIKVGNTVYLSGQIGLEPASGQMLAADVREEITQIFKNITAVAEAAGGGLKNIVKLTIYLKDFENFTIVNESMSQFFKEPYPARVTVGVRDLPRNAEVEIDAVMVL